MTDCNHRFREKDGTAIYFECVDCGHEEYGLDAASWLAGRSKQVEDLARELVKEIARAQYEEKPPKPLPGQVAVYANQLWDLVGQE